MFIIPWAVAVLVSVGTVAGLHEIARRIVR